MEQSKADLGILGSIVGKRYRILTLIGEGGIGVVYECEDLTDGQRYAIKLLHPDFSRNEELGSRFQREARLVAQLKHPNIVSFVEVGVNLDGRHFLVTELLEGETLGERLAQRGVIAFPEASRWFYQVLSAVSYAHKKGIVHRDIKPDNIFFARSSQGKETVKLLDFGMAKSSRVHSVVTRSGQLIGTPSYMSPEQIDDEKDIGPSSDVWALGLVFMEMLLGRRVYDGATTAIVSQIMNPETRNVKELLPTLQSEMVSLLQKAVQRDRGDRWRDATEMMEAFEHAFLATEKPPASAEIRYVAAPWSVVILISCAILIAGFALLAATFVKPKNEVSSDVQKVRSVVADKDPLAEERKAEVENVNLETEPSAEEKIRESAKTDDAPVEAPEPIQPKESVEPEMTLSTKEDSTRRKKRRKNREKKRDRATGEPTATTF